MRKSHITQLLVSLLLFGTVNISALGKQAFKLLDTNQSIPGHFTQLNQQSIRLFSVNGTSLFNGNSGADSSFIFEFPLIDTALRVEPQQVIYHSNGNASFSQQIEINNQPRQIIFTQGEGVGIGEIRGGGQHLYFEQRGDNLLVVDLGISGLLPAIYDNDVVGQLTARKGSNSQLAVSSQSPIVVDIMLLFTQNIVDEFPGAMTGVLLNQLIMRANQAFVDSNISMQLRLVNTQFVNYTQPSDFSALNDLDFALENPNSEAVDPSLIGVFTLREQFGADIVSMIRTHNLNERDVCGVAFFPNPDSDVLVNISNVGISGGSNCMDTFTHEIGHNFGAGHQRENGVPQGAVDFGGALIVNDKFNTIMSSIGTGDENRDLGLNLFSNPQLQCGNVVCGDVVTSDNARTINQFAPANAALRASVLNVAVTTPLPSSIDADGDSILDVNDSFPFDPTEFLDSDLDGVGDNTDIFPNNASESFDTDNDGVGNNSDTDDDNDGINDVNDDLPLDPNESVDLDGDGVGANSDDLDNDFQDFIDSDNDGIGDRNDFDDDNDGVPDLSLPTSLETSEAWIVSAGTDSILRFNALTGDFVDTLLEVEAGGFSFRSDMALSPSQQLFFIAFSDVIAYDPQIDELRIAIDRSDLSSNFPAHLFLLDEQNLFISHGFGPSEVDSFSLSEGGNVLTFLSSFSDPEVTRDILFFQGNSFLVVLRNQNQVLSVPINGGAATSSTLINQGLNLPEHMAIDADSNIYITNVGDGTISQHSSTGDFLGTFIGAGVGGLGTPGCITFGPEGDLYVCSTDTDQVLRFDGDSGAFVGVFADGSNSDLSQPVSIVFSGLPLDELRLDGEHDTDGDGVDNSVDDLPQDETETTDTDGDGVGNNADNDDDDDGMPDQFEIDNGLDPLDPSDANEDADGDGSTNLEEFLAGTDLNSATSTPIPPPAPQTESGSSGGGSTSIIVLLMLMGHRTSRHVGFRSKIRTRSSY